MDDATSHLLLIGGACLTGALAVLYRLIATELAPKAGVSGVQRWFLAAGLSFGLIGFTIKLSVIAVLAMHMPKPIHAPALTHIPAVAAVAPPSVTSTALFRALPPPPADFTAPKIKAAEAALGERLFYETALSADSSLSCASCHQMTHGGAAARPLSLGVRGTMGQRNAPSVYNAVFQKRLFWDGRANSLETQAMGPLLNPIEMAMPNQATIVSRLMALPDYGKRFTAAFGSKDISLLKVTMALAAYERTLISADSPYDEFIGGNVAALSQQQLRGMALFQQLGCIQCHSGPNFSAASKGQHDSGFRPFPVHPTELAAKYDLLSDKGAGGGRVASWRVPSLRNVALTGPYFHNGAVPTLAEAVRIMAVAQCNAILSPDPRDGRTAQWVANEGLVQIVQRRVVSEGDVDDIVAFLQALSGKELTRLNDDQATRRQEQY